ncbi:RNA polymerase sigma factor [Pedobacter agri]|uniref:RNA polymerase sigma-70 factor n=1 Tax=Pedobacter agri TaxID=454586 RepID=A0A9X3I9E0_9SPHI|nr:RNA polymerase sigma-70 factor [Pedobacter agri]MCX3265721.1 RNA polymerase sigma-70 factor [Pedobacter agri]MDQ1140380.1 RNA polymerase sigma-70 factor (ECF subfamily) [Pedobacter agri]
MSTYQSLTDHELFVLMQDGDKCAFEEIYERFNGLLYIYACKMVPDREDARDIVQEIFVYLWSNPNIQIKTQLSSYLYTAVRYKIFDWLDKNKSRTNYLQSLEDFSQKGDYVTDDYIREKEFAALIEKEVSLLPSKMRVIFEMSRRQHLTQKEIAEILHLSDKTVKKQMSNALKVLRLKLTSFLLLAIILLIK